MTLPVFAAVAYSFLSVPKRLQPGVDACALFSISAARLITSFAPPVFSTGAIGFSIGAGGFSIAAGFAADFGAVGVSETSIDGIVL